MKKKKMNSKDERKKMKMLRYWKKCLLLLHDYCFQSTTRAQKREKRITIRTKKKERSRHLHWITKCHEIIDSYPHVVQIDQLTTSLNH
jgi:hypothetical protein